ncbi:hypothetical protein PG985_014144 [Apiospora marii]|uniref:uncharacterized protein n=1 Tax=Apiospora marii TaxID=335849 RepID=UPI00312F6984
MMPWSQQVPPNLQGVLDGQYYPADDAAPPVHDPYYQNPMDNISGGGMAVNGGNNGYGGGVPTIPVANTGDLDNGDTTDYDRDMVYNPFMYNTHHGFLVSTWRAMARWGAAGVCSHVLETYQALDSGTCLPEKAPGVSDSGVSLPSDIQSSDAYTWRPYPDR